jgi:hypothetical protein
MRREYPRPARVRRLRVAAVRYVVLGPMLVEPLLLALRRVAEQIASAKRFGPDATRRDA